MKFSPMFWKPVTRLSKSFVHQLQPLAWHSSGITIMMGKPGYAKYCQRKKNLAWLIVYQGSFRITSYFTEKHLERIADLEIKESIKEEFYQTKPSGKLIPMSVLITEKEQVKDALSMILFKKGLK